MNVKWNWITVSQPTCAAFYLVYVGGNYNRIYYAWWNVHWRRFECGAHPVTHWVSEISPPKNEGGNSEGMKEHYEELQHVVKQMEKADFHGSCVFCAHVVAESGECDTCMHLGRGPDDNWQEKGAALPEGPGESTDRSMYVPLCDCPEYPECRHKGRIMCLTGEWGIPSEVKRVPVASCMKATDSSNNDGLPFSCQYLVLRRFPDRKEMYE
jgi:hypothetical protein